MSGCGSRCCHEDENQEHCELGHFQTQDSG
jgi:hypothetical protein